MSRQHPSELNPSSILRYDTRSHAEDQGESPAFPASDERESRGAAMEINGLGSVQHASASQPPKTPQPSSPSGPSEIAPKDDVEISAEARAVGNDSSLELRARRLARIKAAIDAGEYETPEKLEAALSRLFAEIGMDDEDE